MSENDKNQRADPGGRHKRPIVSTVLPNGSIVELVYDLEAQSTGFAVWEDGAWRIERGVAGEAGERLVPYSPRNNLIRNEVVRFPSEPEEFGSEEKLVQEVQGFIHRYVDLSPQFERIAAWYCLFSWVHQAFAELPYLRLRGTYGVGKTRALLTIGSLCYKPIFASGATSTAGVFRMIDAFGGTLVIDEADFRYSDEKADLVKIFNNGNQPDLPVIKIEVSANKEFNPRAFQVFGPKIVASRGFFEDKALESRFITEEMGQRRLRDDIPISLPKSHKEEARRLRNKLLLYRFHNLGKKKADAALVDRSIEPRLNQIFVPLLSVIDDPELRKEVRSLARQYHSDMITARGMDIEAQLLDVIRGLFAQPEKTDPSVKNITDAFLARYGEDYQLQRITPKWIGTILRRTLQLRTRKNRHGVFVIPFTETPKLEQLYERYGIVEPEPSQAQHHAGEEGPTPPSPEIDMTDVTDIGLAPGPEEPRTQNPTNGAL